MTAPMLFSSSIFVFLFLPVVLGLYFVLPWRARNLWLLVASLFFYAWGEKLMVGLMMLSIVANWAFGLWVERAKPRGRARGVIVWATVFNLGLLIAFKYADWLWSVLSQASLAAGWRTSALPALGSFLHPGSDWEVILLTPANGIRLPIGISFFTFQAFSYVLDVYRNDADVQKSPFDFGLYVSLFPQLIAGPIVRYKDVAEQIVERSVTRAGFAYGVRRFVIGLGKKMLVANIVARAVDGWGNGIPGIFTIPTAELTPSVAWLGVLCYTLQIYFDFSAYSDMAIGLGHMFGFTFLENFDYPYVARSITEFWRRWHISLSTWFRDYLYVPLGGNRKGPAKTYRNLLIVFFLCGLWHGASFNFVVWGLFHGAFLVAERIGLGKALERGPAALRHAYVLLVVMVGWVFFRAPDLSYALGYLHAMFAPRALLGGAVGLPAVHHVDLYLDPLLSTVLVAGVIGSVPWLPKLVRWHHEREERAPSRVGLGLEIAALAGIALVFFASALELSAGTYNPFIYFRF
jgi:alginate O-acetyltransferase complex protein AlgI